MSQKKGFRQPSKKNQLETLSKEIENLSMAVRISQMMIQQLIQNGKNNQEDLGRLAAQLLDIQYGYNATQKVLNIDVAAVQKFASEQRLIDFNTLSEKTDIAEGLETSEAITKDSVIIITSTAEGSVDKGIFRSRVKVSEIGIPGLIDQLLGKKVGDKVAATINNLQHEVEILSIKNAKATETATDVALNATSVEVQQQAVAQ